MKVNLHFFLLHLSTDYNSLFNKFFCIICAEDRRHSAEERRLIQQLSKDEYDEECLLQQVSMLQLKLDESRKNTQTERE